MCRGFEIEIAHNFTMRIQIPSQPWALFGSNERISLIIVSASILISESLVTVSMTWLLGRELSFMIGLHFSLKKSINRFVFTFIFEPLANVFILTSRINMVLKLPKIVHCLENWADLSRKAKSIKAIYLYPSERPHHALSENSMFCKGLSNKSRDIEE